MASNASDVSARLAKAARFIRAAEVLVADGHLDAAPGRAYYGAYHATIALLIARNVSEPPGGRWSHGFVQNQLRQLTDDARARRLRRLYQERLVADYTTAAITRGRAEATLVVAGVILADAVV